MDKILSLLNQPKAFEAGFDTAFLASIYAAFKNGNIQAFSDAITKENVKMKVFATTPETLSINMVDEWDMMDPNIPQNSLLVIYVEGGIYPWKTFRIEQAINQMNSHPNILGALIFMNTPGGYVHRVDITAETIKNSVKPVVTYATGLMCSAGMWLSSGSRRIFAASKLDTIGSIGTMTTYINDKEFWKQMGIEVENLYATKSINKNEESREAEKGNFEPIIENLDYANDVFHAAIQNNLSIKPDSEVFTGATYYAEEAKKMGLIHEIGTLDKAMNYLMMEGLKLQANNLK